MTGEEANRIINSFYMSDNHTDEDKFMFVEAMHFKIDGYRKQDDMYGMGNDLHNLACFYAEEREFCLYQKYLEQSAALGFTPAYEGLGYVWYYGQNGVVDYEQAYKWFSLGAGSRDDMVRIGCECKLADMYHYGYYVAQDEEKYRGIIERLHREMKEPRKLRMIEPPEFPADPYVDRRLAEIRISQGRVSEALELLYKAREIFAGFIKNNPFWWGNIEEMETAVKLIHEQQPDFGMTDIYDLFYYADRECTVIVDMADFSSVIEVVREDYGFAIRFDGKWYRDARTFFERAKICGKYITVLYDKLKCRVK